MVGLWVDRSGVRFASSKPCSVCPIWQVQKPSPMEYLTIPCNTLLRLGFISQTHIHIWGLPFSSGCLLIYLYVHARVCLSVGIPYACSICGSQKKTMSSLGLELQVVTLRHLMWAMGTKPVSQAARALNHWAVFPAPIWSRIVGAASLTRGTLFISAAECNFAHSFMWLMEE